MNARAKVTAISQTHRPATIKVVVMVGSLKADGVEINRPAVDPSAQRRHKGIFVESVEMQADHVAESAHLIPLWLSSE